MEFNGEKTEQPTQRKLEDALKKGQVPRSAEVQTVFVLGGAMLAMMLAGQEIWRQIIHAYTATLGHLHDIPLSLDGMQGYGVTGALVVLKCLWPVVLAAMVGGLLAGGMQSRFQTASEALAADWNRIDPVAGLKRVFSMRNGVPTLMAMLKLGAIIALTYSQVLSILHDPIFYSTVSAGRIAQFMADTSLAIVLRVCSALVIIATLDYTYQYWRTSRDLMMTREEVKEENKNMEGNPLVRAAQRRRRQRHTQRKMLLEVAKADVVLTNPTRLAIALRYDRKTMKAPRIVAKGTRLNAQRIREIAQQHQVPIVENKPLARLMFKYGKVGAEIPAQLYAAVAEILAWVYRINRYRYYTEQNRIAEQN
jgi:flagellar biosynthetic protein FlhB